MEVQLIRNATLKIRYAGKNILVDPYFAAKESLRSLTGKSKNPTVALPLSIDEILDGVDLVLITHLHPDHFDDEAKKHLDKNIEIVCQPEDVEQIKASGFKNVTSAENSILWQEIEINRTPAQHGEGFFLPFMGKVSGYFLKAKGEKSLYIIGDSIWYEGVAETIDEFHPDIIIANAGGNEFKKEYDLFQVGMTEDSGAIVMNEEQVFKLYEYSPKSQIITVHIGALDHDTVTRSGLRSFLDSKGIASDKILIPEDGEKLSF
ncbi:MAG: hypothetical protein CMO01_22680 [Thalassobius sp.]|nr:hypothetical protein [Thalassovita sp.]